ncbi:MAG: hypothetical protein KL840_06215 [Aquamicrobium sp.]|nr:hypothetical protein [Aquamicrobium sp.]
MAHKTAKPEVDFKTAYLAAVLANALRSLKQKDVDALIVVANAFFANDPKGRATLLSNVKRVYDSGSARCVAQPDAD